MLLLDPQSYGTTKYPLSVCFSVRHFFVCPWFVSLELFSRTAQRNFLIFFHKTRISSNLKSDKVRSFWKEEQTNKLVHHKNRFERFSKFYEKLTCEIFMIFCMKLQQKVLKLILSYSLEENLIQSFQAKMGSKWAQKWSFSSFMKDEFI